MSRRPVLLEPLQKLAGRVGGAGEPLMVFMKMKEPEDRVPPALLYEMADTICRSKGAMFLKSGYERLGKSFQQLAPDSVYLHVLKGACYGRYAIMLQDSVEAGAWQQSQEYLGVARQELEKAYQMDQRLLMVPTEMLKILFRSHAERAETDKWFARAMAVNPDNALACSNMLGELPAEQKLDFARQCFERRNWRGRIAFVLVDAHERMAQLAEESTEYWKQPQVWKDIKAVYDMQLLLYPDAVNDRSYYALLANRCGQWAEAERQFKILGDKPSMKVFGSMASYNYQRKKAVKNLAAGAQEAGK